MLTLITQLRRSGLLSPRGLSGLIEAVLASGINLMALLRLRAWLHPERIALVDEAERLSYGALWRQAEALARELQATCGVRAGHNVAIICRSHSAAVKAIFASSRLGANVLLLNPELRADQIQALAERPGFDFVIYDEALGPLFSESAWAGRGLPAYHPAGPSIDLLARHPTLASPDPLTNKGRMGRPGRASAGSIVVMTGGTTGMPKAASRRPAILSFLPPFLALLSQARLASYRAIYVASPIYHGYGLAILLIGLTIGAENYLTRRFEAARACALVAENKIEAAAVVPLMLQRMLRHDPDSLASLRCVIAGSAPLSPVLAQAALGRLGPILFNLYGTSEAGFAIMATPELLATKPESIGWPLIGVRARIVNEAGRAVAAGAIGRLRIRSAWSADRRSWVDTGDLARRDGAGAIFLCGRADDMIVSGGENVYPVELEQVLARHPDVAAVAVIGIDDPEFGQRLKAFIVARPGAARDPAAYLAWLKPRVARYQMPAAIELRDELPYTALGKPDKQALR